MTLSTEDLEDSPSPKCSSFGMFGLSVFLDFLFRVLRQFQNHFHNLKAAVSLESELRKLSRSCRFHFLKNSELGGNCGWYVKQVKKKVIEKKRKKRIDTLGRHEINTGK